MPTTNKIQSLKPLQIKDSSWPPQSGEALHQSMATKEEQPQVLENKEEPKEDSELPLVVVHRSKNFNLPLQDRLQSHFHLLDPNDSPDESTESFLSRHAHSARALLCVGLIPLTADTLGRLPSLELVVGSSAGVEHIDLHECRRRGIMVTGASAAFSEDAADYAVALLIDVLRRISAADRFVRGRLWPVKGEHPLGFKVCFRICYFSFFFLIYHLNSFYIFLLNFEILDSMFLLYSSLKKD